MDFVANMMGTLIRLEEDENSRFRFEVWFDYTKRAMNLIREGAMLAVPNFASNNDEQHLSILEVVSILPMHYALGDDARGYPGFVVEAAKSAVNDWEEQETEPTEDVTKIRCIAIPTNFEVVQSTRPTDEGPNLQEESNLPMVGASVHLLDTEFTEYVANYGIREDENTIIAGALIRDANVRIRVRVEDLLRTHFGVFGFTGAGKSNLVSTLVSRILTESRETVKIVVFDLMGEYSTLLIDHLTQMPGAMLIALGEETLPDSVFEYVGNPNDARLHQALRDLTNTTLLPRALTPRRRQFAAPFREILTAGKIRFWRDRVPTVDEFIEQVRPQVMRGNLGRSHQLVSNVLTQLQNDYQGQAFTAENVEAMLKVGREAHKDATTNAAREGLDNLCEALRNEGMRYATMRPIPPRASISIPQLIARLNDATASGLYIIQSHNPDTLRHFAWMLGTFTFKRRRRSGQITPLVSFVFDEADEFIPQQARDTYAESSDIAMTLARRGRKFGLGIGIATQRVRYLNTSIMAQPHTYFVSKMPRQSDRQVVAEAFGVSEDMFRQTFKFKKGDWLLMSYDATGLEAIPIPIHGEDANERVKEFLERINGGVASSGARTR
jgi:hypothetical protein